MTEMWAFGQQEIPGYLFEVTIVLTFACCHLLFRSSFVRKIPKNRGESRAKCVTTEDDQSENNLKQQSALVRAVSSACRQSDSKTEVFEAWGEILIAVRSRESGCTCPLTQEMMHTSAKACMAERDATYAAEWLGQLCRAGYRPPSHTVLIVMESLIAADDALGAEALLASTVGMSGLHITGAELLFEHCVPCLDTPRVRAWLQRLKEHGPAGARDGLLWTFARLQSGKEPRPGGVP